MVYEKISARVADVHEELKKLLSHLDEFPDPTAVAESRGPKVGAAWPFTYELGTVALQASNATKIVIEELAKTGSTIRAALKDLTEHDEELADSAERFENFLDSATEFTEPSQSSLPATRSGSSGSAKPIYGDY